MCDLAELLHAPCTMDDEREKARAASFNMTEISSHKLFYVQKKALGQEGEAESTILNCQWEIREYRVTHKATSNDARASGEYKARKGAKSPSSKRQI
eukprot:scaffold12401_cov133-Isochrysis_galbana.AAC.7